MPKLMPVVACLYKRNGYRRASTTEMVRGGDRLVRLDDALAAIDAERRAALTRAAEIIELYDDATMRSDYMIDSAECAGVLSALAAAPASAWLHPHTEYPADTCIAGNGEASRG